MGQTVKSSENKGITECDMCLNNANTIILLLTAVMIVLNLPLPYTKKTHNVTSFPNTFPWINIKLPSVFPFYGEKCGNQPQLTQHFRHYTGNGLRKGSSVIIATDFGLDGPGLNPGGDGIFRPPRPAPGPTQHPVK